MDGAGVALASRLTAASRERGGDRKKRECQGSQSGDTREHVWLVEDGEERWMYWMLVELL